MLPPRGQQRSAEDRELYKVVGFQPKTADGVRMVTLQRLDEIAEWEVPLTDLVVVAEFRDSIFPGLVSKTALSAVATHLSKK